MIVSMIRQFGLRLRADPEEIPFQHSANVQMQFIKDENYNDYTVVGYYILPDESEAKLLNINDDGTFTLGPDCFKNRGTLSFSFNLINSQEEVHLGSIDFEIRYAFGDSDTILPEPEEVWISLVTQVAKDAIREEVALVKQKANEALQSASLANDKANEAQEYANNANQSAGSASLSASSALTAKNDAIAASNSASQFSDTAGKSAVSASDSANTAKTNANKTTEDRNEVERLVSGFDSHVVEKTIEFNQNATDKSGEFDSKVEQANTTINGKVSEATKQAEKATEEANRATLATDSKLDKNQGTDNAGKTMVVGADGNLVVGDSSPKNVYTKEEVDYLLDDKMDKPYVPIEITDSTTLNDCLAGNFKIDKIKGNTYQNVEENIVPTPQRPVPINSRKVKAGERYVELRSLKESVNVWDYNNVLGSEGDAIILNSWATSIYNVEDNIIQLKSNTKYTCQSIIEMISSIDSSYTNYSYEKVLRLFRKPDNKYGLPTVNIIMTGTVDVLQNGETRTNKRTFTTPGDLRGCEILMYTERWTKEGSPSVNATVKFKNIMLVEGDSVPDSYVPPTVRDYKIVNHTTKTSKIVRNVHTTSFNKNSEWSRTGDDKKGYRFIVVENQPVKVLNYLEVNNGFSNMSKNDKNSIVNDNKSGSGWYCTSNSYTIKVDGLQMGTLDDFKQLLGDNEIIFQCQLQTPAEESITYIETDVNEVGYSWQDTTSPSPDVPSEVRGVEKIDITVTGKNLFDINDEDVYLSPNITHNGNQIIKNDGSTFPRIKLKNLVIDKEYTLSYSTKLNKSISNGQLLSAISSKNMGYPNGVVLYKVGNGGTDYNVKIKFTATQSEMYLIFSVQPETITNLQIELGDTATSYESYKEQHINITPPQPMYSTLDGSIADEADVEKGVYRYWLLKDKIGNLATAVYFVQKYGNFQSYSIIKVKDNSLKPITLLGNEDTRNLICNKCNVNLLDYNNKKETFSLYVDKSAVFVGNINIERLNENTTLNIYNFIKDFEIVYPLLTPIEIPIPSEDLEQLKKLKTGQGVTNIFVDGEVKPTIEAKYPQDIVSIVNKLQTKLLTLQEEVVKNV